MTGLGEQLPLCLGGCLPVELFSSRGPYPEAGPCVLEYLWGGQTGWPRQMDVCVGRTRGEGRCGSLVTKESYSEARAGIFRAGVGGGP